MRLTSCSNSHFIQAIKDGSVIKVLNVNSRGKPRLVFKQLDDIFRAEDEDFSFQRNRIKAEAPYLRLADRTTSEIDPRCCGSESFEEDCNELDLEMTLRQTKERCKKRKRSTSKSALFTPKTDSECPVLQDDGSELKQPLSCLKLKLSKIAKSGNKRVKKLFSASSEGAPSVESEQSTDAKEASQSSIGCLSIVTVKAENPEPQYVECGNQAFALNPSNCSEQVDFYSVEFGESLGTPEYEFKIDEIESFANPEGVCVVNGVSYAHLNQDVDNSFSPLMAEGNLMVDNKEKKGEQSTFYSTPGLNKELQIDSPPSNSGSFDVASTNYQTSNLLSSSQNYPYLQEISQKVTDNSPAQANLSDNGRGSAELSIPGDLTVVADDVSKVFTPTKLIACPHSTWTSHSCSGLDTNDTNDDLSSSEENQPLNLRKVDTERNCLENRYVELEDASPRCEDMQPFISDIANANRYTFDIRTEHSISRLQSCHYLEPQKQLERLPSMRKVMSPASQKKLVFAINSLELSDDIENYKCKEKFLFGEQEGNGAASEESEIMRTALSINSAEAAPGDIKVTVSPKHIFKKPRSKKSGCPPKGCLEGPRLCRSLPRLSTGCTSIQDCSRSAIAFSQRQMQDIEALAVKLMTELKSMKDIVDEKLLYEAYRSPSLMNDADEVKSALKTATKAEDTARKWLSMMARDCNRFCKIMKLVVTDSPASENTCHQTAPRRVGKKISFADEAGGMLCDVKSYGYGLASEKSKSETGITR